MLKKGLTLLTLICLTLPMAAWSATWQLTSRVNTAGGNITVDGGAPQTAGAKVKIYNTDLDVPVVITADAGYKIRTVSVNGVAQTPASPATFNLGPVSYPTRASQSISVSFTKELVAVTATAGTGGTVSPRGTYRFQVGTTRNYVFAPNGLTKKVYSISGLPAGAVLTYKATGLPATLPADAGKAVKVSFAVPASAVTMNGVFSAIIVSPGTPQVANVDSPVTLNASATTNDGSTVTGYAWTQTGGPGFPTTKAFAPATAGQSVTFTPTALGSYLFKVVATTDTGATATAFTTVRVVASTVIGARTQCQNCHKQNGVGAVANVFGNWSTSKHKANVVLCAACHVGANTGAHPGANALATCATACHASQPVHSAATATCTDCHNVHSLARTGDVTKHYNKTGALVPGQTFTQAQFKTAWSQCSDCHGNDATDAPPSALLADFASSAHGDINGMAWTDYDFKTRTDCVVCHTAKGFVDGVASANANSGKIMSAPAWGTLYPGDTTKQVLGCNACHSSSDWANSVRTTTGGYVASMGGWGKTTVINFPDVGESNICIPCHAARENGASIIASVTPGSANNTGFKNPHYLAAAAVFYGKGGFRYYGEDGKTGTPTVNVSGANGTYNGNVPAYSGEYGVIVDGVIVTNTNVVNGVAQTPVGTGTLAGRYAPWSHGKLGMDNYTTSSTTTGAYATKVRGSGNKGQCVACHLGPENTHTYNAFEVAKVTSNPGGAVGSGCYGCHNGEDMEEVAELDEKPNFDRLVDFFKWNLEQYGINYTDAYPYFTLGASGWNVHGGGEADIEKTMGAAMNLKLILAEKGSHVHNRGYMRHLAFDSIQYLQFGAVTYSNSKFYYGTGSTNLNDVLNFTNYSTAVTPAGGGLPNRPAGNTVSISSLKSYIITTSTRTNPIQVTTPGQDPSPTNPSNGTVPGTATYGATKYFRR